MDELACKRIEADSPAGWLNNRRLGLGASESPVILGVSRWGSRHDLFARKLGLLDDDGEAEALEWGRRLEGAILAGMAGRLSDRESIRRDENVTYQSRTWPWMTATPDAFVVGEGAMNKGYIAVVEAKQRDRHPDELPPDIYCQVQHQMAVTGLPEARVGVLIRGRTLAIETVPRDDEFIAKLVPACRRFWDQVTAKELPPDPDETVATARALLAIYPQDGGATVELGGDMKHVSDALLAAKEQRAAIEGDVRALQNKLRQAIGAATFAKLPDGTVWSLKTVAKKAHEVKATSYRQLRLVKDGDDD